MIAAEYAADPEYQAQLVFSVYSIQGPDSDFNSIYSLPHNEIHEQEADPQLVENIDGNSINEKKKSNDSQQVVINHSTAEIPAQPLPVNLSVTVNMNDSNVTCKTSQSSSCENILSTKSQSIPFIPDQRTAHAMMATVVQIQERIQAAKVRKEPSPVLRVAARGVRTDSLVDEGATVNLTSEVFASKAKLTFQKSDFTAQGADKNPLAIMGETVQPVSVMTSDTSQPVELQLGKILVVRGLGVDLILGQPAKVDNRIVTIPHMQVIELPDQNGNVQTVSYPPPPETSSSFSVLKITSSSTVVPNDSLQLQVPPSLAGHTHLAIASPPDNEEMFPPQIIKIENNIIKIPNQSTEVFAFKKHQVVAHLRACRHADTSSLSHSASIRKIYNVSESTAFQKIQDIRRIYDPDMQDVVKYMMPNVPPDTKDYQEDVLLDPDLQLSEVDRDIFRKITSEFGDVVTPHPARYNGRYGMSDTSIDFSSIPPVSNKVVVVN